MPASEIGALPLGELRLIVLLEARAAPCLRYVEGIWCRTTRTRLGSMTALIRRGGLLDVAGIDAIVAEVPTDPLDFQRAASRSRSMSARRWDRDSTASTPRGVRRDGGAHRYTPADNDPLKMEARNPATSLFLRCFRPFPDLYGFDLRLRLSPLFTW